MRLRISCYTPRAMHTITVLPLRAAAVNPVATPLFTHLASHSAPPAHMKRGDLSCLAMYTIANDASDTNVPARSPCQNWLQLTQGPLGARLSASACLPAQITLAQIQGTYTAGGCMFSFFFSAAQHSEARLLLGGRDAVHPSIRARLTPHTLWSVQRLLLMSSSSHTTHAPLLLLLLPFLQLSSLSP